MKYLIYILIGLFSICTLASSSFAQKSKDAFAGKSKKGPNVYSSKPPKGSSKGKLYGHSISKKKVRKNRNSIFSSSKRKYKSVKGKSSKGGNGAPGSSGGRKSGKARKKEK
jgi:hypothetical protein